MSDKPKILFYDIETSLHMVWAFSLGKQVVRHNQLVSGYFSRPRIICISYSWADEKKVHTLDWGFTDEDEAWMIKKFAEVVAEADVVIGKNNKRFDDKQLASAALFNNLVTDIPELARKSDDLERHMRRTFYLPSYSLDYLSKELGIGGKMGMEFGDWITLASYKLLEMSKIDLREADVLVERLFGVKIEKLQRDYCKALTKMITYNKKDVTDTKTLWNYCVKHFEPKFNYSVFLGVPACKRCGSKDVYKKPISKASTHQHYHCPTCNTHAGKTRITAKPNTPLK
jgi:DNA polymerase elongation subunit (family B)